MCTMVCIGKGTSQEALSVLSDVLGKFLDNFSQLFHMNASRCSEVDGSCCGFRDALERSLHEVGFSGKEGLCRYWKEEVEGRASQLDAEADEIRNKCLQLTVSPLGVCLWYTALIFLCCYFRRQRSCQGTLESKRPQAQLILPVLGPNSVILYQINCVHFLSRDM